MRTINIDDMRVVSRDNGLQCQAWLDGEWVGVSILGEDEALNELPEVGDVLEAGTETVRVQSRSTATLFLGRNGMGSEANEADFEAWVDYVSERIDERTGLDVTIEIRGTRDVQDDRILADYGYEQSIHDAMQSIWCEFCADASAWPKRS